MFPLKRSLVTLSLLAFTSTTFAEEEAATLPLTVPSPEARQLPADFWNRAADVEGDEPVARQSKTIFPILFYVARKRHLELSGDRQEATNRTYDMLALGFPYCYLPLYYRTTKDEYSKANGTGTVGTATRSYNPIASVSSMRGEPGTDVNFKVQGMPLFWEGGSEKAPSWHFNDFKSEINDSTEINFNTILWWIGPAWATIKSEKATETGTESTRRNIIVPLFLLYGPGAILWSHGHSETTKDDSTLRITNHHGPFLGYGLWHDLKERPSAEARNTKLRRLLLGGILWMDSADRDENGTTTASKHGPLWGAFGVGKHTNDAGETQGHVRFLWLKL